MVGILVQLAVSWLIIWLVEKKHLGVLGLMPTGRRLSDFGIFFIVTALCAGFAVLLRMYFAKEEWGVNQALSFRLVLEGLWWNIKSVVFEELIFRGVLFYILIKKAGLAKAIIISSVAFGVYHWFSYELWGRPMQMAIVFVITGLMGVVLAYGYAKSWSLYIPVAIHLGWNFTNGFVFSQGSIGNGVFVIAKQPSLTVSWMVWFIISYLPLICVLVINYLLIRRRKQSPMPGKSLL